MNLSEIKNRIISGEQLSYEEAVEVMKVEDKNELYDVADEIRAHFHGNSFHLCSIINAKSGKCSENCKWCSQSAHNDTDVEVYDVIDEKTVMEQAQANADYGVKNFSLVTSGHSVSKRNLKTFCNMYKKIKKKTGLHTCASMGLLKKAQLQQLKDVGVGHYHCNLETAPSYFDKLCSTHTMDDKIKTIGFAKDLGFKVCSGGIIGMGESMEQRVELACKLREIGATSIPINVLNPITGTPLADAVPLSSDEILSTFAIFRLINPNAQIRFAGGRNIYKSIEEKALKTGINASLVGDLLTTLGSNVSEDIATFKNAGFDVGSAKPVQKDDENKCEAEKLD